jgi:hypothetical protein
MEAILITAVWLIILLFSVRLLRPFRLPGLPWFSGLLLFSVKFICGILLTQAYTTSYTDRSSADIYKFYDDSRVLYDALEENPRDYIMLVTALDGNRPYYDQYYVKMKHWSRKYDHDQGRMSDTRLMIRLNALIMLLSAGVYQVHILFWCFFSLAGLSLLYRAFFPWFTDRPFWLASLVFLIPSVLCWGSGVLKEGFLLLLIGLLLYPLLRIFQGKFNFSYLIFIMAGVFGFALLKLYVLIAFLPAIVSLFFVKQLKFRHTALLNLLVPAIMIFITLNLYRFFPEFDVMEKMAVQQQDMLRMAYYTGAGSVTDANPLAPTWTGFLRNLPEALLNATLRPSLVDVKNSLQLFAAIENTLIALVILLTVGLYQPVNDPEKKALLWFCLSFTFMLFALTGLTTPVLGTLVRYRMPGLPFLGIALLLLIDTERLVKIVREIAWLDKDDD